MKKGRKGEREAACALVPSFLPFLPSACVVAAREGREGGDDAMHKSERERIWKVGNVFGIKWVQSYFRFTEQPPLFGKYHGGSHK